MVWREAKASAPYRGWYGERRLLGRLIEDGMARGAAGRAHDSGTCGATSKGVAGQEYT